MRRFCKRGHDLSKPGATLQLTNRTRGANAHYRVCALCRRLTDRARYQRDAERLGFSYTPKPNRWKKVTASAPALVTTPEA